MEFKVLATNSNFKIMSVHATGSVSLQLFADSTDAIVSVGEQELILVGELNIDQAPAMAGAFIRKCC